MKHSLTLRIGPATFRIGSAWRGPIDQLARLFSFLPVFKRIAACLVPINDPMRITSALNPKVGSGKSPSTA